MYSIALIVIYCVLIIAASLLGGWLPMIVRLTHTRMQLLMSFVGGLMLGVAILHMLPHGITDSGSIDWGMGALLLGLMTTFLLMRLFHFHEHVPVEVEYPGTVAGDHHHGGHLHCEHDHGGDGHHDHDMSPTPAHAHGHAHSHEAPSSGMRWLGVFLGLSLHTFLDGVALAAGVTAAGHHASTSVVVGLGVFLGIFLHKPLDALSITVIMRRSHWPVSTITVVNLGYALMCPLGVILFFMGYNGLETSRQFMIGMALCFSAGVFLCISLADILPEVQFHSHDKGKLTLVLLLGVGLAYLIGFTEPGMHKHDDTPPAVTVEAEQP
ncbi:ZIP family metal transporter [Blastopirellula marina]|uniref:Iron permease n=1 Tax=Blastopirellula marina TaxID=124 RepID=A0A2S8FN06_9BACT|nr:ZIP family metal transporter [Blastopirellula marina]PQO33569.1 iron permease [Blastopirellula marina]PTL43356.1 iron permease [Blastopirellula marina]